MLWEGAQQNSLVKPTFINGRTEFDLLPPRVNYEYRTGIKGLLMLPPFHFLANITPGLIHVALCQLVCMDFIMVVCARAALDKPDADLPILDRRDSINQ